MILRCPSCEQNFDADPQGPEALAACPHCKHEFSAAKARTLRYDASPLELSPGRSLPVERPDSFPQDEIFPPGSLIGTYRIESVVGRGGMGTVYRATQPGLERTVALKILPRGLAEDRNFVERFQREAKTLARLSHPGILAIFDFGVQGEIPFFAMEYVDGVSLREILNGRKLSAHEALKIVPQICEALEYAHGEGVVHRDIKPENILIDKRGRVKIADFGLAKLMGTNGNHGGLTRSQVLMGTVEYMAPEQREKARHVDHRADIYSLGVVFYEMLTGELPIGRFDPPSRKVEIDVRLDEVVLKTLEKDPERRYQRASHVRTDIERITSIAQIPVATAEEESPRESDPERGKPLDLQACIDTALATYWKHFGLMIVCGLVVQALCGGLGAKLIGGIPYPLFVSLVWGPISAGMYAVLLAAMRRTNSPGSGRSWRIEPDMKMLFSRFSLFLPLIGAAWLYWVFGTLFLPFVFAGLWVFTGWIYVIPLIGERRMHLSNALGVSWRVAHHRGLASHVGLACLFMLVWLLTLFGYFPVRGRLFGLWQILAILATPFGYALVAAAYRQMFEGAWTPAFAGAEQKAPPTPIPTAQPAEIPRPLYAEESAASPTVLRAERAIPDAPAPPEIRSRRLCGAAVGAFVLGLLGWLMATGAFIPVAVVWANNIAETNWFSANEVQMNVTASLIVSVLTVVFLFLTVVVGLRARRLFRKHPSQYRGVGFSKSARALVTGSFFLVALSVLLGLSALDFWKLRW